MSEADVSESLDAGPPLYGSIERPLTVSEITHFIKSNLESTYSEIVIVGEISNFKPHPSGHFYFNLKDEGANLSAVMFRQSNARLKFRPQDGHKVIAVGRITVYPPRGNYQINITRMEPEGLGALQLAFEQLKKKLEAEGFFAKERKRPIPKLPSKVGIVTAASGAALRDILNILNRRFAGLHILIYPVKVQGVGAAEEVAEAIHRLNAWFPEIEVLIVGRGGGSIEDLWAFNEEVVARAIFASKIPVISAVGHEVDFTIADFVADLRAPTPSAAAELVVSSKLEILNHLDHLEKRLLQVTNRLELAQMRLDEMLQRIFRALEQKISESSLKIERLQHRLTHASPKMYVQNMRNRFMLQWQRLQRVPQSLFDKTHWRLDHFETKLKLLNPKTIMNRGYSIVRIEKSKKVVTKVSDVRMGDKLLIELAKGKITARV